MKKRLLSIALCLCMVLTLLPTAALAVDGTAGTWDGTADTTWYNAADTTFTITTAEQLAGLAELTNGGNKFEGKTIKLGNDLDLSSHEWTSIGTGSNNNGYFGGTFDGQYHTISNMTKSTSAGCAGLFGAVSMTGAIRNLGVTDANVHTANNTTTNGILAGWVNQSTVINCYTTGSITSAHTEGGYQYVGGLVGYCTEIAQIIGCYSTATVTSSDVGDDEDYVGGLIGDWEGSRENSDSHISDCWFGGKIVCDHPNAVVGGILGFHTDFSGEPAVTISNCMVTSSDNDITIAGVFTWIASVFNPEISNCMWPDNSDFMPAAKMLIDNDYNVSIDSDFNTAACGTAVSDFTEATVLENLQKNAADGVKWVVGTTHPTFSWDTANQVPPAWVYPSTDPSGNFSGGSGTEDNPYLISSAQDLADLAYMVNNGEMYDTAFFKMTNNIDLNEGVTFASDGTYTSETTPLEWVPIGFLDLEAADPAPFCGTFDGDGNTIKGLYINESTKTNMTCGLFGYIDGDTTPGTVENLNIVNSYIGSKSGCTGSVAGVSCGIVTNCTSSADIYVKAQTEYLNGTGGIVGNNNNFFAELTYCTFNGTIKNEYYGTINGNGNPAPYVGGIAGDSYMAYVAHCVNNGTIWTDQDKVGGVVGNITEHESSDTDAVANKSSVVEYCVNNGKVIGQDSVGGVVGMAGWGTEGVIRNCANYGNVESCQTKSGDQFGGIVGYSNGCVVSNCYNSGNVSGYNTSTAVGGVAGKLYSDGISNCWYLSTDDTNTNLNVIGEKWAGHESDIHDPVNSGSVTAEQAASGEAAWILNTANDTTTHSGAWSQNTNGPILADATHKATYKVTFDYTDASDDVVYSSASGKVNIPTTAEGKSLTYQSGGNATEFTADTIVTEDITVTVNAYVKDNLSNATVTLANAPTTGYVYTGIAHKPAVQVVFSAKTLTEGTDYTVSYADNINAGTATVTVTGTGEYAGTNAVQFTINKAPVTVKADNKSMTKGDALPSFTVTYTGFMGTDGNDALQTAAAATCTADGLTAGGYAITFGTEAKLTTAAEQNYSLTHKTGFLTVNEPAVVADSLTSAKATVKTSANDDTTDEATAVIGENALTVSGKITLGNQVLVNYTSANGTTGTVTVTYETDKFVASPASIALSGKTYSVDVSGMSWLPAAVKVAEGAPTVALPSDITSKPAAEQETISAAADALKETGAIQSEGLTVAATDKVSEAGVSTDTGVKTIADATTALNTAGVDTSEQSVTLVTEPYLDIEVKGAETVNGTSTLTLNITPYYNVKATTADDPKNMIETGDDQNTTTIAEKQPMTISTPVTITIPLPNGFPIADLFVAHEKNGRTYYYAATISNDNGINYAKFTTPHGFSDFKLMADAREGTIDFGTSGIKVYNLSNVGDTLPTPEAPSGQHFTNWTIGGNTYTALTNDLLAAINGTTLTATANFEKDSIGGGGGGTTSYTLTFDTNGGSAISKVSKSSGTTIDLSAYKPTKTGYTFDGWYTNAKLTDKVTSVKLTKSMTVYAKWTEDTTVSELPFTDVASNAYYFDAVKWAVENGITSGTTATTFAPGATCTRAQTVTFLWRAMGSPEPTTTVNPFTDVASSAYYYKAVLWAVEKGITVGTSATTFAPDATVTRAQVATFLWRAAGTPAATTASTFTDVPADAYYAAAVLWAAEKGITSGTSATTFSPANDCTRAQIVTFLYRYLSE